MRTRVPSSSVAAAVLLAESADVSLPAAKRTDASPIRENEARGEEARPLRDVSIAAAIVVVEVSWLVLLGLVAFRLA